MSTVPDAEPVEDGQFDDAPDDNSGTLSAPAAEPIDYRAQAGHRFIDEENILEWSSESEDDDEQDEFEAEDDEMEAAAFEQLRAEDEDWEIAERGAHDPVLCELEETNEPNQTSRNSITALGSMLPCAPVLRKVSRLPSITRRRLHHYLQSTGPNR